MHCMLHCSRIFLHRNFALGQEGLLRAGSVRTYRASHQEGKAHRINGNIQQRFGRPVRWERASIDKVGGLVGRSKTRQVVDIFMFMQPTGLYICRANAYIHSCHTACVSGRDSERDLTHGNTHLCESNQTLTHLTEEEKQTVETMTAQKKTFSENDAMVGWLVGIRGWNELRDGESDRKLR